MKYIILIGVILMLVLSGCGGIGTEQGVEPEVISLCGDDVCEEGENKCSCAADCGECSGDVEGEECVELKCVEDECKEAVKMDCCGNKVCEKGEELCGDCPSCTDYDRCTKDWFDPEKFECVNEEIAPCCGNGICEADEDCENCLFDCECDIGLENYPDFFDGKKVDIIVGYDAPSIDVVAGIDLTPSLDSARSMLDNEIESLEGRNAIVIGTPCDNKFSAELMPYTRDCLEGIQERTAVIALFKTSENSYAVLVAGNPSSMTREAAGWLRDYSKHDLERAEVIIVK